MDLTWIKKAFLEEFPEGLSVAHLSKQDRRRYSRCVRRLQRHKKDVKKIVIELAKLAREDLYTATDPRGIVADHFPEHMQVYVRKIHSLNRIKYYGEPSFCLASAFA